jgi:hypothetical protein
MIRLIWVNGTGHKTSPSQFEIQLTWVNETSTNQSDLDLIDLG